MAKNKDAPIRDFLKYIYFLIVTWYCKNWMNILVIFYFIL